MLSGIMNLRFYATRDALALSTTRQNDAIQMLPPSRRFPPSSGLIVVSVITISISILAIIIMSVRSLVMFVLVVALQLLPLDAKGKQESDKADTTKHTKGERLALWFHACRGCEQRATDEWPNGPAES